MLRAIQAGISIAEMELLTIGQIHDIIIESGNDHYDYPVMATQEDMMRL